MLCNGNLLGTFPFLLLGLSLGNLFFDILILFAQSGIFGPQDYPSQTWRIFSETWIDAEKIAIIYITHSALLYLLLLYLLFSPELVV